MKTFDEQVHADVQRTLEEDVGTGDLIAALIPTDRRAVATIICRESAVICGRPWVNEVLRQTAPAAQIHWFLNDGDVRRYVPPHSMSQACHAVYLNLF